MRKEGGLKSDVPGEHWVIDVVHMPTAKDGYKFMITMIDVCSRYAVARKAKSITASQVASDVLEAWSALGCHVVPKYVTHDGGQEFKETFAKAVDILQKHRHVSMARRSDGHGMVERYNRDLTQLVAKMCHGKADQYWPWAMPGAVEAHNASIHVPLSLGIGAGMVTPNEILYGEVPKLQQLDKVEVDRQLQEMAPSPAAAGDGAWIPPAYRAHSRSEAGGSAHRAGEQAALSREAPRGCEERGEATADLPAG